MSEEKPRTLLEVAERLHEFAERLLDIVQPATGLIRDYYEGRSPKLENWQTYVKECGYLELAWDNSEGEPVEVLFAWMREEMKEDLWPVIQSAIDEKEQQPPEEGPTA